MFPSNFAEGAFTHEELARFRLAISKGRLVDLTNLVAELTPQKEIEIQKLSNHFSPIYRGYEEKVKGFLANLKGKENLDITSPEQEAQVQRLIDKELAFVKNSNKIKASINELNTLMVDDKEKKAEIKKTIDGFKETLNEMEKDFDKNVTLKNVRIALQAEKPEQAERADVPVVAKTAEPVVEAPKIRSLKEQRAKEEMDEKLAELDVVPKVVAEEVSETVVELSTPSIAVEVAEMVVAPVTSVSPVEVRRLEVEEAPVLGGVQSLSPKVEGAVVARHECCGSRGFKHMKNCPLKVAK